MSFEDCKCIIIDPGSSTLKAGFAGDDAPRVMIPSVIGRPRLKLVGYIILLYLTLCPLPCKDTLYMTNSYYEKKKAGTGRAEYEGGGDCN